MSGFNIATILDKKDRTLPKPINNRPGFDLKYAISYIGNYIHIDGKRYDELFDNEKLFDNLSIIKQDMTPVQWAMR
ncbi:13936_t:CDS:1, partial [Racocetra fulgida]